MLSYVHVLSVYVKVSLYESVVTVSARPEINISGSFNLLTTNVLIIMKPVS